MASARAHINPAMLVWARERVNAPPDLVARRAGTSEAIYAAWERGEKRPTIKQLRKVATYLRRPAGHFYLDTPPDEPEPRLQMRRVYGARASEDSPEFALEVHACMRYRATALDLFDRLGQTPPELPATAQLSDDPEEVAERVRFAWLDVPVAEQAQWRDAYTALRAWRQALEDTGVLSFQLSRVSIREARGFAVAERPLPVAAFNARDSVRGRMFTLLHEFAHILLGASTLHGDFPMESDDATETWCNRLAAAVLVPRDDLLSRPVVKRYGPDAVWLEYEVEHLADRYHVSPSALVRRLHTFGCIADAVYDSLRERFDARRSSEAVEEENASSESGGNFYNNKLARLGSLLPSLAFQSFYAKAISARDLSSILGTRVKNLATFERKVTGHSYAFSDA